MASFDWGPVPARPSGPVVVTLGTLPPQAQAAIDAAGVRVSATLGWDMLDEAVPGDALVLAGVPGDIGHGMLERFAGLLEDGETAALVAVGTDAIDVAWTVLAGTRAELLCDATPGDWVAALAMAGLRAGAAPAAVREGRDEADRLRRLHEEVARIAAQLSALAGADGRGVGEDAVADRRTRYAAGAGEAVRIDAAEIRRVIRGRRLRAQFFDPRLLEDPGWDMLLDLFAAELEGIQVSVSSLCIAAAVAPTTALRWISRMVEAGLMLRVPDAGDRRRAFVALSPHASDAMRAYVDAARKAGLPPV